MANLFKERTSYLTLNALELAKSSLKLFQAVDHNDQEALNRELGSVLSCLATLEVLSESLLPALSEMRDEHARGEAGAVPSHDG
jgi:hypothetical protein